MSGYIPTGRRTIKPGYEFDKYFPKPDNKNVIVLPDAGVKDTLKWMANVIERYKDDCKEIAKILKGRTTEESIRNVHSFIWNYIQYKLDPPGKEILMRPAYLWQNRHKGGDCDDMTIFAACTLYWYDLKDRTELKAAGYDPVTQKLQHVYDVIYNKNGSYYTLDAVIGKPFYEKPYVAKLQYSMKNHTLSGLPIHVLSGIEEDSELEGILSGADFETIDGFASPQQELDAIYNHLVRTRDYISKNPESVLMTGGAKNHLTMLNYAISKWNTSERDHALNVLEREEQRLNELNGLSGATDDDEIDGLGKIKGLKKFWSSVKTAAKNVGQGVKNVAQKVGTAIKNAGRAIIKNNPLSLAARGGFLLAMKMNLFNMAKKLYPGYMTEQEWAVNKISPAEGAKARLAVKDIEHDFDKKGGDVKKLKEAITEGRAKKKYYGVAGFGILAGLGEVAMIATTLATASGAIVKAGEAMDKAGINDDDKQSFKEKIKNFFKKLKERRKARKAKRAERKAKKKGEQSEKSATTDTAPEESTESTETEDEEETEDLSEDEKEKSDAWASIKKFAKDHGGKILGGAVVLTAAGLGIKALMNKSSKASPSFAGLGKVTLYHKGKRVSAKHILPKGSKVKAVTYNGVGEVTRYTAKKKIHKGKFLPKGKTIKSITLK